MSNKSTLSFKDRTAIYERLKTAIVADAEDASYCAYRDGVSDATVAADLRCSPNNVRSVRAEMFGKLRVTSRDELSAQMAERLRLHEERLKLHEARLKATYHLLLRVGGESNFKHLKELRALRELYGDDVTVRG